MSSGTQGNNGTLVVAGPDTIQVADFYVKASILHPLVIGSIAIIVLFTFLRFISNRSIAAMNVTDWIANVAIGSTLAGIVNGNSLARGMLGLATILGFQFLMSFVPGYKALCEDADTRIDALDDDKRKSEGRCDDEQNDVAGDAC
ncbi:hypothetical protein D6C90_09260 [Aureobasidium pullulans]|uniref:Uncharacterized protein n=1 Tax=Aureobasidium pullulans TaxID=5580 RepID=A0A4S8SS53_AURPU|nr:hypothetical protein D6D28_02935 [Aureobasidium pullulans]THZ24286.1 hypothetical protein D6C90_09260 [Aureobasidium pullulans]